MTLRSGFGFWLINLSKVAAEPKFKRHRTPLSEHLRMIYLLFGIKVQVKVDPVFKATSHASGHGLS